MPVGSLQRAGNNGLQIFNVLLGGFRPFQQSGIRFFPGDKPHHEAKTNND